MMKEANLYGMASFLCLELSVFANFFAIEQGVIEFPHFTMKTTIFLHLFTVGQLVDKPSLPYLQEFHH